MNSYKFLLVTLKFICCFGWSCGKFEKNHSEVIACNGGNANLDWNYYTNISSVTFSWHKIGHTDTLLATYFGGTIFEGTAYSGRIKILNPGSGSIILTNVSLSDNGAYRCTAQSTDVSFKNLIVAEAPSRKPHINKTSDYLTCVPPQYKGIPKVKSLLKDENGKELNSLTVQTTGTYYCCLVGNAVSCLSSATEICVNETLGSPETRSLEVGPCHCPFLSCVGEFGFCVLWIILIVTGVLFLTVVFVLCYVCRKRK